MSWIVVNNGFGEISTRDMIMQSSVMKTKERFDCGWKRGNLGRQTDIDLFGHQRSQQGIMKYHIFNQLIAAFHNNSALIAIRDISDVLTTQDPNGQNARELNDI